MRFILDSRRRSIMSEKAQIIDEFWLKVLAFISMALDHVGLFLVSNYATTSNAFAIGSIFRIVGRLAFPLFAFFLSEGLKHTKNKKDYLLRLFFMWLGIALIETILYSSYRIGQASGNYSWLSSFGAQVGSQAFTDLLLFALFVYLIENQNKKIRYLSALPVLYIIACYVLEVLDRYGAETYLYFPAFLRASYNLFGFLIFLGFYYAYKIADIWVNKGLQLNDEELIKYQSTPSYRRLVNVIGVTFFLVVTVLLWGISYLNWHLDVYENPDTKIQNYCLLDCLLLLMYSGKRGYDSKWWRYFEYAFYPLHIAIIAIVFTIILR